MSERKIVTYYKETGLSGSYSENVVKIANDIRTNRSTCKIIPQFLGLLAYAK